MMVIFTILFFIVFGKGKAREEKYKGVFCQKLTRSGAGPGQCIKIDYLMSSILRVKDCASVVSV